MKSLLVLLALLVPFLALADLKSDQEKLQGTWEGTLTRDQETIKISMELKGDKATLTFELGGNSSKLITQYKLEKLGSLTAFVMSDAKDDNGQQVFEGSRTSIYRFVDEGWVTANGFSEGDDAPPSLITWKKKN